MSIVDALTVGFNVFLIGLFVVEVKQERYGSALLSACLIGFGVFVLLLT